MKRDDSTTNKLWQIAEPICNGAGYELVDIALAASPRGSILRVFIDHLAHSPLPPLGDHAERPGQTRAADEFDGGPINGPGDGSRIQFADCERVSRELSAVLDVEDPIPCAYDLEVSSPGLDRPLRKREHFERFVGHRAKVMLRPEISGRRKYTGTLVAVRENDQPDNAAIILAVDGAEHRLPLRDIASARLAPDWDALFKGAGRP